MRGREHDAILCAKFIEQRDGERRAFFWSGAGAHFVDEHQGLRRGGFEHRFQIQHVRGKCGKIGGDGLLVADVDEHAIEQRQARRAARRREFPIARRARRVLSS